MITIWADGFGARISITNSTLGPRVKCDQNSSFETTRAKLFYLDLGKGCDPFWEHGSSRVQSIFRSTLSAKYPYPGIWDTKDEHKSEERGTEENGTGYILFSTPGTISDLEGVKQADPLDSQRSTWFDPFSRSNITTWCCETLLYGEW